MKQLKDYLHLYLECEIEWFNGVKTFKKKLTPLFLNSIYKGEYNINNVKPILRPLSDMTDEEDNTLEDLEMRNHRNTGYATAFLLSKHFDVFELIEDGLAIDKTTLTTK